MRCQALVHLDIKKDILWRVYLCFLGMVLLGAVVVGRSFYIQQVEGEYWRNLGNNLHLKYLPIAAERGTIYSEDGNMQSKSAQDFDVYIHFGADGFREKNGDRFRDYFISLTRCRRGPFK